MAVREGVTNVLRHSHASTCAITATRQHGQVRLQLDNDGAPTPTGQGSGLTGPAERATALAGTVTHQRTPDGRFRLLLQVPEAVR